MWFLSPNQMTYDASDFVRKEPENKLVCRTCKKDLRGLLPEGIEKDFVPRCGPRCYPGDDGERIEEPARIAGHHGDRFKFR